MHCDNKNAVRSSFLIAQRIAERVKPYSVGNFMKKCLINVAQKMCSKMVKVFEKKSVPLETGQ